MNWQNKTIAPKVGPPPKVQMRYPCPGLCRFIGMVCFLAVGLGVYYGGAALLGLERLDWAAPTWTAKHFGLLAVGLPLAILASLLGFSLALRIEVRSEPLNYLFITLWQFLANGTVLWFMTSGAAMSVSLGREEAEAVVLRFGAERAFLLVIIAGCVVGLLSGIAFFLAAATRSSLIGYLTFSATASLLVARSHFHAYGIGGKSWVLVGLIVPLLLLLFTPSMIERDRRQRRLVMEQSS